MLALERKEASKVNLKNVLIHLDSSSGAMSYSQEMFFGLFSTSICLRLMSFCEMVCIFMNKLSTNSSLPLLVLKFIFFSLSYGINARLVIRATKSLVT